MEFFDTSLKPERAVLFGIHRGSRDALSDCTDASMEELELLAQTAGAEVLGAMVQNRQTPENTTYLGEGKAEELRQFCQDSEADLVICDDELSGIQVRNLENILEVRVIDRSALIMDIFAASARTREGQLQVELAQLRYFLPRLTGSFTGLSRQGGGGGIGGARRGPGETQLETDRRHIRTRISNIEEQLREVERHRDTQRRQRKKEGIRQIAIVGYTNAGKSTLLNLLTDAGVLAEDKLFATLDPTARRLTLPDGSEAVLIDTVGFIRKLPHHLIKAFRSTLEEAVIADVLVHVADAASPDLDDNIAVVEALLGQLGAADKPVLMVLNKIDLLSPEELLFAGQAVPISAKSGFGTERFLERLCEILPGGRRRVLVRLPYSRADLGAFLHRETQVLAERHTESGTEFTVLADEKTIGNVRDYLV